MKNNSNEQTGIDCAVSLQRERMEKYVTYN